MAGRITLRAKQADTDTIHIHLLLQAVAGEYYPYNLLWLCTKMVNRADTAEVVPVFVWQKGTGKSKFE